MKKLLLVSTAVAGLMIASSPASAAVKLDLGGYFSGYGIWSDNDEIAAGDSQREFDLRRHTEVYVSGETTLDNGLTVGFHTEQELGGATLTDEAYAYFSGGWGRVNLGSEDGAAYLLQVGGPSADSNIDGMRVYFQTASSNDTSGVGGVSVFGAAGAALLGLPTGGGATTSIIDYDHVSDPTAAPNTDRITYLTPKFNGFQAGVSYAPETGQNAAGNNLTVPLQDDDINQYENIWEIGARWDGEFQGVGIAAGGGYSSAELESKAYADPLTAIAADEDDAPLVEDGLDTWNAGLNFSWNGFALGGSYGIASTEQSSVIEVVDASGVFSLANVDVDLTTWTVGLGYDNGPYHVGGSYINTQIERDSHGVAADGGELAALDAEVHRFTVGGGYTFGPGMTFRGSVSWGEFDNSTPASDAGQLGGFEAVAADQNDFQQISVGTDIQF